VKDIDIQLANTFLNFLLKTKKYDKGYSLKKIADLKTVCNNAELNGIKVNPLFKKIQSSRVQNKFIIYLNPQELDQIENTELKTEGLQNARKWLLLGCAIGQRGGDLLRLSESNFINRNGLDVIELKQQKTGKNVMIPISPEAQRVIDQGLPYPISIQKFNNHIKEVCRLSKIDKPTKGSLFNPETKRKIEGVYPKWMLIASHVCRRSLASNLYGAMPTALIMQITAHGSEKMLLNYIGKSNLDHAQQIADYYILQAQKQKQEPQLPVIKKVSNDR
jgi:integrase